MMKLYLLLLLALAFGGCISVKPLVVSQQTQLENQILGRLRQLEADVVLASSVRGPNDTPVSSELAREATQAARRRAFNADDIDRFKDRQRVGEGRDGRVHVLQRPTDRKEARWLKELVSQENADRDILMRRVIQLDPALKNADIVLVAGIFARMMAATARSGHRIQTEDGKWVVVQAKPAQ